MISLFLVEDERIARESIRDNVPWQEHDILFLGDAPDGEVALPQLLEKRPDILLTDIKMPFMDGLELARIVRKELPDTSIIILSGHNEFEYARKAITLGVNDYLLKPVSSSDILEAVDRSKAQILECRAQRIERQSYNITQRELFFSNLYSGILMGPAQMLQRAAEASGARGRLREALRAYGFSRYAEPEQPAEHGVLRLGAESGLPVQRLGRRLTHGQGRELSYLEMLTAVYERAAAVRADDDYAVGACACCEGGGSTAALHPVAQERGFGLGCDYGELRHRAGRHGRAGE